MIAAALLLLAPLQEAEPAERESMIDAVLDSTGKVLVVTGEERTIARVDVATGRETGRTALPEGAAPPWAAAPAPGGTAVAILTFDHRVWFWLPEGEDESARGPRHVATVPGEAGRATGGWCFGSFAEWASTGERVLVGAGAQGALLLDGDGETVVSIEALGGSWFHAPLAWAGDGSRFALALNAGVEVWDAESGAALQVEFELEGTPECVDLSADGQRLAVGATFGWAHLFDVASGERVWASQYGDPFMGPNGRSWIGGIRLSPDGKLVAVTLARSVWGGLLSAQDGSKVADGTWIGGRMGEPAAIEWSPDSSRWSYAMVSGVMPRFWMSADGKRLAAPRVPGTAGEGSAAEGDDAEPDRGFAHLFTKEGWTVSPTYERVDAFDADGEHQWTYRL